MPVHISECPPQSVFVRWNCDDVYMIGHQAIRPDFGMSLFGSLGEQVEIQGIIAVFKKGAFTPIATLGYVVRNTGKDESWPRWKLRSSDINDRLIRTSREHSRKVKGRMAIYLRVK
jgi:hypothetical protein